MGNTSGGASDGAAGATGPWANLGAELRPLLRNPVHASNWELVSAAHSKDGHPLAVMGPQVGYYVPEILMEEDLHAPASAGSPGIDARGAAFPGVNLYVELGHGDDYAWSATTATSDNVDTFAEVLCHDAYHYMYKGHCLAMQKLTQTNSWTPSAGDQTPPGSETLTAYRTVHGIVYARAKVKGKPVAFVHARSTYFHEADSALGFSELNDPRYIRGPASFQSAVSKINFLFNWAYVDASHISYYMSGWMPQRATGTSPDFPILGTGKYDWKGYSPTSHTADWLPFAAHPHATDQPYQVSWNNKQAPGWAAADDQWGYGPIFRSQLIANRVKHDIAGGHKMDIAQLVQSMDEPATEDIRAVELLPIILKAVGHPGNARLKHALSELRTWEAAGGHRRLVFKRTGPNKFRTGRQHPGDRADGRLVAEAAGGGVRADAGQDGVHGRAEDDRLRGHGLRRRLVRLRLQGPAPRFRPGPRVRALQPAVLRKPPPPPFLGHPAAQPLPGPPALLADRGAQGHAPAALRRRVLEQPPAVLLGPESLHRGLGDHDPALPVSEPAHVPAGRRAQAPRGPVRARGD